MSVDELADRICQNAKVRRSAPKVPQCTEGAKSRRVCPHCNGAIYVSPCSYDAAERKE